MDEKQFKANAPGQIVSITDASGASGSAFIPHLLPPKTIDLGRPDIVSNLSIANIHLGRLDGIASLLEHPEHLFSSYLRREAQLSSAIEGTNTTMAGIVLAQASRKERTRDESLVIAYVNAFNYGRARIPELRVGRSILSELHAHLMASEKKFTPGLIRDCQVVVGSDLSTARFVPPPHYEIAPLLDNLETYLNTSDHPALVKLAIAHYQFETIHPFRDGNGRLGRMMIPLWLQQEQILTSPMLYISAFLNKHKQSYYDHLLAVSTDGAWEEWIYFFLDAVAIQARDAAQRTKNLLALRKDYYARVSGPRSAQSLYKLIDDLFTIPAMSVPAALSVLGVSYNAARANIGKLEEVGILTRVTPLDGVNFWMASELVDNLNRDIDLGSIHTESPAYGLQAVALA